jgi:deazaflavin-dependent oxidoreductase (nitroreductase family)
MKWIRHALPLVTSIHRWLYTRSRGRFGGAFHGLRFLMLEHMGRKSGQLRRTPLLYVPDRGRFVLAASNAGQDHHPAWWLNLEAKPEAVVQVGGERCAVSAYRAAGEEQERLWALLIENYSGFAGYRAGTRRDIPIVVLRPTQMVEAAGMDSKKD